MRTTIKHSLVSVMALGSLAYAGGDIAPVAVEEPVVVENSSDFYVGLGYGYFNQSIDNIAYTPPVANIEFEVDTLLLQAGYQYNKYVAFEGRYWLGLGDISQSGGAVPGDYSGDFDAWGLYVKPMYPVTEAFDVYALLGYADSSIDYANGAGWDTDGFSWGIGLQYEVMENLLVFADYVSMASDDSFDESGRKIDADIDLYTLNFGVSYKF